MLNYPYISEKILFHCNCYSTKLDWIFLYFKIYSSMHVNEIDLVEVYPSKSSSIHFHKCPYIFLYKDYLDFCIGLGSFPSFYMLWKHLGNTGIICPLKVRQTLPISLPGQTRILEIDFISIVTMITFLAAIFKSICLVLIFLCFICKYC